MESSSNQNTHGNTGSAPLNVELMLPGIDTKWVRSNGSWVDKSKIPAVITTSESPSMEIIETTSSHWWQFWKA